MGDRVRVARTIGQADTRGQEILEAAMEYLVLFRESQSSVEITQDAKGSTKLTVKCYADTVELALERGIKAYNDGKKKLGI